jgi:TRAP-type C4-dicarboxylate transport system substrate-binding protein
MKRTISGIVLAAATATGLAFAAMHAGAAETEWRFDGVSAEARPDSKALAAFTQAVNEQAGDALEIKVFFGESLGVAAADTLRALKSGAMEMAKLYAAYYGRDAPDAALTLVQGAALSLQEIVDVAPTVREIYTEVFEGQWGVKTVGWTLTPAYDMYVFCREPVNTIEDLKKYKVRVSARDQIETFKKLGIAAQIIPQADLYVALQTGVVDCALHIPGLLKTISLQEVVDYGAYLHPFAQTPQAIAVNQAAWDELPANVQEIILKEANIVWENSLKQAVDTSFDQAAIDAFTKEGSIKFLDPFPEADRKAFFDAAVAAWKEQADAIGKNAPAYHERVVKALEALRQ